jgi:hypothetical protein
MCNPQIYYTNQYYARGFSQKICLTIKILFIVDLYGQNPIRLSSSLFCIFSIYLLFSKISNIVYAIFNNVIGLYSCYSLVCHLSYKLDRFPLLYFFLNNFLTFFIPPFIPCICITSLAASTIAVFVCSHLLCISCLVSKFINFIIE